MAKQNGKVPGGTSGTFVSDKDLNDLNELLSTYRDYILSHEARLEIIEAALTSAPPSEGELIEPSNDPEER